MRDRKNISKNEALLKAKSVCSLKEFSTYDIREKLFKWGITKNDSEDIVQELVNEKYIDEERYTRFYVRDKYRFNKWGRIKIKYQLLTKQIPEKLIYKAFDEIDENEYERILTDIISKKIKIVKSKNKQELVAKLLQYTASKGYEYEQSYKIIQKLIS